MSKEPKAQSSHCYKKDLQMASSSPSSMTRAQRNQAEKMRRDKLNSYVSELAGIVPMVAMASKRLDKTSILRLSAAHLRLHHHLIGDVCGTRKNHNKPRFKWKPNFMNSEHVWDLLEAVDGFILVMTDNGKVIYVSQSIDRFLGHHQVEVIGHSFYSFVHPLDCQLVKRKLQEHSLALQNESPQRCSFHCRLRERGQPRSEVVTYQTVHVVGHLSFSSESTIKNVILFKSFIRLLHSNPYSELTLTDAIEDEYTTRHNIDGTIIFADHRLSTITGHLPNEVTNYSAYKYILAEDCPLAMFAHKQMFTSSTGTGSIVYRLRTQNNSFIFLKSVGYLQYNRNSDKVDHFLCVNKLLEEKEGEKELKKFKDRFTPHIENASQNSLFESIKSFKSLCFECIMTSFQSSPSQKDAKSKECNKSIQNKSMPHNHDLIQNINNGHANIEAGTNSKIANEKNGTVCGVPHFALPQSMSPLSDSNSTVGENTSLMPYSHSSLDIPSSSPHDIEMLDIHEVTPENKNECLQIPNTSFSELTPGNIYDSTQGSNSNIEKFDLVSFNLHFQPAPPPNLSVPLSFSSESWCVSSLNASQMPTQSDPDLQEKDESLSSLSEEIQPKS